LCISGYAEVHLLTPLSGIKRRHVKKKEKAIEQTYLVL
jgi:hypothetical protein